jgi:polysaccharide biosynthesis protein PslG
MITRPPLSRGRCSGLTRIGALLFPAVVAALLSGGGTAVASAPVWGFHAGWADYCYSHLERKATTRIRGGRTCLPWESRVTAAAKIGTAAETGAQTIRINTSWTEGSWRLRPPPPGERYAYEWGRLDRRYRAAQEAGMRPIIVILDTPLWARRADWRARCLHPGGLACAHPPRRATLGNFQDWAAALMRRYPDALAIEVWNEPNSGRFWAPRPRPRHYARLLWRVHAARVQTRFSGAIVLGGLAPALRSGPHRMRDARFLREIYSHARSHWFDGIGHHPYPFRSRRSATTWVERMTSHLDRVLRVRNRHGHHGAGLWLTELGIRGGGAGFEDRTVHPAHQGPILERLYRAAARYPVNAIAFYTLADLPFEGPRWNHFGVVDAQLHPKAAFCHLRRHLGGLSPCEGGLPG